MSVLDIYLIFWIYVHCFEFIISQEMISLLSLNNITDKLYDDWITTGNHSIVNSPKCLHSSNACLYLTSPYATLQRIIIDQNIYGNITIQINGNLMGFNSIYDHFYVLGTCGESNIYIIKHYQYSGNIDDELSFPDVCDNRSPIILYLKYYGTVGSGVYLSDVRLRGYILNSVKKPLYHNQILFQENMDDIYGNNEMTIYTPSNVDIYSNGKCFDAEGDCLVLLPQGYIEIKITDTINMTNIRVSFEILIIDLNGFQALWMCNGFTGAFTFKEDKPSPPNSEIYTFRNQLNRCGNAFSLIIRFYGGNGNIGNAIIDNIKVSGTKWSPPNVNTMVTLSTIDIPTHLIGHIDDLLILTPTDIGSQVMIEKGLIGHNTRSFTVLNGNDKMYICVHSTENGFKLVLREHQDNLQFSMNASFKIIPSVQGITGMYSISHTMFPDLYISYDISFHLNIFNTSLHIGNNKLTWNIQPIPSPSTSPTLSPSNTITNSPTLEPTVLPTHAPSIIYNKIPTPTIHNFVDNVIPISNPKDFTRLLPIKIALISIIGVLLIFIVALIIMYKRYKPDGYHTENQHKYNNSYGDVNQLSIIKDNNNNNNSDSDIIINNMTPGDANVMYQINAVKNISYYLNGNNNEVI